MNKLHEISHFLNVDKCPVVWDDEGLYHEGVDHVFRRSYTFEQVHNAIKEARNVLYLTIQDISSNVRFMYRGTRVFWSGEGIYGLISTGCSMEWHRLPTMNEVEMALRFGYGLNRFTIRDVDVIKVTDEK